MSAYADVDFAVTAAQLEAQEQREELELARRMATECAARAAVVEADRDRLSAELVTTFATAKMCAEIAGKTVADLEAERDMWREKYRGLMAHLLALTEEHE